jgi:hypothetical protein
MINVLIDEFTSCLKDAETGDIIETEVIRIKRKSFLSKFNTKTGWYVNWEKLVRENEVYALVVKGTVDIQGMVALQKIEDYGAVYISWMCAAPHNNPMITNNKKYIGVGGHLFAIAVDKSIEYGFEGAITGNAADKALVNHYCKAFGAIHLGMIHPYQIFIDEEAAAKIREVYDYEWTDDEL